MRYAYIETKRITLPEPLIWYIKNKIPPEVALANREEIITNIYDNVQSSSITFPQGLFRWGSDTNGSISINDGLHES